MSTISSFQMHIPQLNRLRTIWVYLPDNYSEKGDGLPVIYMHDGQNLFFDDHAAYGASWRVGEAMDELFSQTGKSAIVVGVDNDGERRLSEYSPWRVSPMTLGVLKQLGKHNCGGEGALYADFCANTLKSFVDSRFNTNTARNATAIAGSSMGGLISCYIGLKYQQIYGTMGLFSTHSQFNQWAFDKFLANTKQVELQHAFVYCGGFEYGTKRKAKAMQNDSVNLYKNLQKRGVQTELLINSTFVHNEQAWAVYFSKFVADFVARCYQNK